MEFPQYPPIRSSTASYTASTTISYPADVQKDDTLILISNNNVNAAESGWTLIVDGATASNYGAMVQFKIADGTEGGTTFTAANTHYQQCMIAVEANGAAPNATATGVQSTVDTPNPPALTLGAAEDFLWFTYGAMNSTSAFTSPIVQSGYTSVQSMNGLCVAQSTFNSISSDPAAFTDGDIVTGNAYAANIAIRYSPVFPANVATGTTTMTVPVPPNTQEGDILVLVIMIGGGTMTTPSGWTVANSDLAYARHFYKVAGASETDLTYTQSLAVAMVGKMFRFPKGTTFDGSVAAANPTGLDITLSKPDTVVIGSDTLSTGEVVAITAPTGWANITYLTNNFRCCMAAKKFDTAGTKTGLAFTSTGTDRNVFTAWSLPSGSNSLFFGSNF